MTPEQQQANQQGEHWQPPLELPPGDSESEIHWDVMQSLRKVLHGWKTLGITAAVGLSLGLALGLTTKPWYTAQAVFLPPKAELANPDPMSFLLKSNDLSDSYLGMLTSRTVADDVIDHLNLMAIFHAKLRADARTALALSSKFSVNKNSFIVVDVTADSPRFAADIANAYLAALYRLDGQMVDSASSHRKDFFEVQLEEQHQALNQAELDLKNTQEKTGVVLATGEAQADLNATAQLQAQIGQAEARLAGLSVSSTNQNPEVVEARSQLDQLKAQLARQQSSAAHRGAGSGLATNGQLPTLALQNGQKEREVRLRETVYDSLVQQYERARLAATDPGPQLQVVDVAIPPERKSGPSRRNLAIEGFIVGLVAGLLLLLLGSQCRDFIAALRKPPAAEAR